ncbi:AraC family transcriptional regulator [Mucilaginibacter paludis]|uniref:Transcriptional regulator, AraC family n=1 Tax=Mucilaginibacter paludis DSM 18603 TaxID=714943 RepID=H1YGT1_9SPHI|nr:helix-turn-helix domain-containing protein [Mucilaginibacter paludis]EHQ26360.1 transcriptional regulator, AraC family [Mucilaginibacter paludis DSM 18603]
MHLLNYNQQVPVYRLEPDEIAGNKHFRVYNFEGGLPNQSDLLIPHRKDHYLIAFIRRASSRQWIDMVPYVIKDNTIYFTGPNQVIVKEGFERLWSTGIAFTSEFLSLQENAALSKLPLIQNPENGHELTLTQLDIDFVEDMLAKINAEYQNPSEWQYRMLTAYLTVLLTYLSRLYQEQFKANNTSIDKMLLQNFQKNINERFRDLREVADYASLLHISAGHLSEFVKTQSGKPAIKHIHDRLVLEARRLLFHTNNSLKEIAFDIGFADASYFNRFFKRETGVTPAEYRANIRKMYH